jgi:transketolase
MPAALPALPGPIPAAHGSHEEFALRVREHVIRMSAGGGCFIGASLSCVDLLAYLYRSVLRVSPSTIASPDRDYLFLSKGHAVPALYGTLAELGFFPTERLRNHLAPRDSIYWHPSRAIPGVEFQSGSLGHLLSLAIGVAIDIRLRGGANRAFVILGDGELDEGSIWEGLLVAHAQRLDHLVLVVDRNAFQANVRTEELSPLEPLAAKLEAFGCAVHDVDGHDFGALAGAFARLPRERGRPTAVVARTVRGKGLPSLEARADRWFVKLTEGEAETLLDELRGRAGAPLDPHPLTVR